MPGVGLRHGHEEMNPVGPIHGIGNTAVKGIERGNFCFPERRIGIGKPGQRRGDTAGRSAVIIVAGDDAHVGCHRRIVHGRGVIIGLPVLVFRQNDFCRSHIAGHQGIVKVGGQNHESVAVSTGRIRNWSTCIGFVLDGDGVEVDAVRVLHVDHVTSQLTGISLIAGREKIAAIGSTVIAL